MLGGDIVAARRPADVRNPLRETLRRWFMAASVIRDLAALNKVETLPWDVWSAMPRPGATLDGSQRDYFDQLAALAFDPDASVGTAPTL
jgi:hypothetical protein